MQITLNGEAREVSPETTVTALIEQLQLRPRGLAVERNRELVPRQQHATVLLCEGDSLEIVTLVGGG